LKIFFFFVTYFDGLYAGCGFYTLEILSDMSYKKYQIEIRDTKGERYTITINELFLLILCCIAEGLGADRIKEYLDELKIVREQTTIEGYIQQMKTEMFMLKPPGSKVICSMKQVAEAAKRNGLIAKRNNHYEIIIEETIAARMQPKLFDPDNL
jgi:hypothetical protein